MTGTTHRLGGAAIGIITADLLIGNAHPALQAATIAGAILGSLIPDIDNPRSSISCKWRLLRMIIGIFQSIVRGLAALLPHKKEQYVRSVIGHRGISHSLTMCAIVSILLYFLCQLFHTASFIKYFFLGIPAGMVSHILLDMLAGGSPLFSPFSVKRVTLAHIKTGGVGEWIFRSAATLIFILFFYNTLIETGIVQGLK